MGEIEIEVINVSSWEEIVLVNTLFRRISLQDDQHAIMLKWYVCKYVYGSEVLEARELSLGETPFFEYLAI